MMKKILAIVLISMTILGLTACGTTSAAPAPEVAATEEEAPPKTSDTGIVGYWGVTNYGYMNEDGSVESPRAVTSKKSLQEESGVELLMAAFGEDYVAQFGYRSETVKGTWVLDEANTTDEKWCYEITLDDGSVWDSFILTDDTTQMYIPADNDIVIILGTSVSRTQ